MSYMTPPQIHPSDLAMKTLREEAAAKQLTPGELQELHRNLSPEDAASLAKSAGVTFGRKHAVRIEYRNGEQVIEDLSAQHRSNTADPVQEAEGVLAGITSPTGGRRGSFEDVKPGDLVRVGGVQTTVENAVRVGYLVKGADGVYAEPAAPSAEDAQAKAAADAEKAAANEPIEALTPELASVIGNLQEMTGGRADNVVASVIAKGIDGNMKAAGAALARGTGIHPEQAEGNVSSAISNAMASTAALLTSRYQVDGEATLAHIAETMGAGDRAQLALALYRGDSKAFQRCAEIGRRLARAKASPLKH